MSLPDSPQKPQGLQVHDLHNVDRKRPKSNEAAWLTIGVAKCPEYLWDSTKGIRLNKGPTYHLGVYKANYILAGRCQGTHTDKGMHIAAMW